jgi:hypothetical protein
VIGTGPDEGRRSLFWKVLEIFERGRLGTGTNASDIGIFVSRPARGDLFAGFRFLAAGGLLRAPLRLSTLALALELGGS